MSQSRLNSRRILESAVVRRWRADLNTLVDQLADGWALLVEDTGQTIHPPVHTHVPCERAAPHATHDTCDAFSLEAIYSDPLDQSIDETLRLRAGQTGLLPAPSDFVARVCLSLPAGPPPYVVASGNPYEHLREHAGLVVGTLTFSALLMFGSSWMIAAMKPSLAFTILAALVSLVIMLVDSLRLIWQTAAMAASNPFIGLLVMAAPIVVFVMIANQLSRWPDQRLREA